MVSQAKLNSIINIVHQNKQNEFKETRVLFNMILNGESADKVVTYLDSTIKKDNLTKTNCVLKALYNLVDKVKFYISSKTNGAFEKSFDKSVQETVILAYDFKRGTQESDLMKEFVSRVDGVGKASLFQDVHNELLEAVKKRKSGNIVAFDKTFASVQTARILAAYAREEKELTLAFEDCVPHGGTGFAGLVEEIEAKAVKAAEEKKIRDEAKSCITSYNKAKAIVDAKTESPEIIAASQATIKLCVETAYKNAFCLQPGCKNAEGKIVPHLVLAAIAAVEAQ